MLGLNTDTPVLMADLFDDGDYVFQLVNIGCGRNHSIRQGRTLCFFF